MQSVWLTTISGIIFVILCVLFTILLINLLTFYRLRVPDPDALNIQPAVSILVPARNEANCIETCVRSLIGQEYQELEILVLNDQSSDTTAKIVQHIIDELPAEQRGRLRLLQGEPLPEGWIGKNFACYQLARQARGDYLLFTDADTIHAPAMTASVIKSIQDLDIQLLSAQPEHVLGSLGERLVVPLLNFTILTLLPLPLVRLRPEPSLSTGNGQLLCFQRSTYDTIGGHAAIKNRILEDVLLAREVKAAGYRMAFVDAQDMIRCRMYDSFKDVWHGFSKNLFAFYNYSLFFALIALLLNLLLFMMPPLLLLAAPFFAVPQQAILFSLSAYLLTVLMRMLLTIHLTHDQKGLMLLFSLLHPISIALECLILLNSIHWRYRKTGTAWKGRQYAW